MKIHFEFQGFTSSKDIFH